MPILKGSVNSVLFFFFQGLVLIRNLVLVGSEWLLFILVMVECFMGDGGD